MLTDLDTLRLRFEASERESEHGFNLHKYGIGYADEATQARWEAWIACRAAMLQGAEPVQGWIPCGERMPGMGVDVLACTISPIGGFEEIETAQWHGGMKGEQPVFITSADAIEPTHWMPLPAAPKQELK